MAGRSISESKRENFGIITAPVPADQRHCQHEREYLK